MLPQSGTLLGGRYRLRRCVGEGGMGAVFEAWQEDLRRTVAVKIIGMKPDAAAVSRFQREARAAAGLGNAHIVQIYDFQSPPDEPPFLVMELLSGASLSDLIKTEGPLRPERVARIARHVLDALGAAHAVGIIHRDIKPGNIFVVPSATLGEVAKVLDFGVAKLSDATTSSGSASGLIGTIAYMAPEQAAGETIDGRSDVYAVAASMFVACTLKKPYEGDTAATTLRAILSNDRRSLGELRPDLDPAFVAIVEHGMAYRREQRFGSALAMAAALEAWLAGRGSQPFVAPSPAFAQPAYGPPVSQSPPTRIEGSAPGVAPTRSMTAPTLSEGQSRAKTNLGLVALAVGLGAGVVVAGGTAAYVLTRDAPAAAPTPDAASADAAPLAPVAPSGVVSAAPSATDKRAEGPKAPVSQVPPSPKLKAGVKVGQSCSNDAECGTFTKCTAGKCACEQGLCGGECVMLTTNVNCGRCGGKCATGEMCVGQDRNRPADWHCVATKAPAFTPAPPPR
ncbi:MAG: protein kinase [Myxococcales bacterium]|nr:protein kinase [Myxococcales bacterium]